MPLTELKGLDLQTGFFTYRQIKATTNNFNVANKIREGGFGSVYKVFDSSFSILEWIYISILSFYSPYLSLALGERDKMKCIAKECIFSILDAGYSIWWYCNCNQATFIKIKARKPWVCEWNRHNNLQHPNLVRLYGCCIEGKQLLLVYEYMENNSLAYALFGKLVFHTLPD